MIGRFAQEGVLAQVGTTRLLKTAAAGLLIVAALLVNYLGALPEWVVIGLSLGSLCLTGLPIVWGAAKGLVRLQSNVDELVSIAIVASMLLGEWISAAIVAFIMVLGSLIEELVSSRSRKHIEALCASSPEHALLLDASGAARQVPISELKRGDQILVRPGDVIAADGIVEDGESSVDESLLTGESEAVDKAAGDRVCSGTINHNGSLKVRVDRLGEQTAHGKILQLIRDAESHRAPIMRVAESYARWFTPTILLLAAAVWVITGQPHRAVAMLIVGCPCAFVLATPTAIIAAMGRASRRGILIKGGRYLEACAQVDALAFDKTGTLTTGRCRVVDVIPLDGCQHRDLLAAAARLEARAEHPLAHAIQSRTAEEGITVTGSANIQREAGLGIVECGNGRAWRIGNRRFMERHGVAIDAKAETLAGRARSNGLSVVYLALGQRLQGLLSIEDTLREEAPAAVDALRADGFGDIRILTGDTYSVAHHIGGRLGLTAECVQAELLPDQKYEHIRALEQTGRRVCYVGDGANDGPALALATVGVSLGSRENTVALETADVVLMRSDLTALPFLFRLSKATTRTINQNLFLFGLLFNGAMLVLSGTGVLTPILGALAHNVGSVAVVLNSSRLLLFGRQNGQPRNDRSCDCCSCNA